MIRFARGIQSPEGPENGRGSNRIEGLLPNETGLQIERSARLALDTIERVDVDTSDEISRGESRVKALGGNSEDIREAREKLLRGVAEAKEDFMLEFLDINPGDLRSRVAKVTNFLSENKHATVGHVSTRFSLEPKIAQLYFTLAQSFGDVFKKQEAQDTETTKPKPEKVQETPPGKVKTEDPKNEKSTSKERETPPEGSAEGESGVKPESGESSAENKRNPEILKHFNLDNRNFIQKLPERTWVFFRDTMLMPPAFVVRSFAGRVHTETMKTVEGLERTFGSPGNKIGILFNSLLIDRQKTGWIRYNSSLEGLQVKYDSAEEEIKELQGTLIELDAQEKDMQEEGSLTAGVKLKIENAREKLKDKIRRIEGKKKELKHRLEETQARIKRYEDRRSVMAQELLRRLQPKMVFLVEVRDKLMSDKKALESELEAFDTVIKDKQEKIIELVKKIENNPRLKKMLGDRRKRMTESINNATSVLKERFRALQEVERRLGNVNERLNPWLEMKEQFEKISSGETDSISENEESISNVSDNESTEDAPLLAGL